MLEPFRYKNFRIRCRPRQILFGFDLSDYSGIDGTDNFHYEAAIYIGIFIFSYCSIDMKFEEL